MELEIVDLPGDTPDPSTCWWVEEVARGSPAEKAGLARGDWLVALEDSTMLEVTPRVWEMCSPHREYRFYLPARSLFRRFTAVSPLGLRAVPSAALIVARFDPKAPLLGDFFQLWRQGAYQDLRRCCHRVLWPDYPVDPVAPSGLLGKLRGFFVGDPVKLAQDTPLTALYGAARFELGKTEEGMQWLERFAADYMSHWTLDSHSLVNYYRALVHHQGGRTAQAVAAARLAYIQDPHPKTRELLIQLGEAVPELCPWLGQVFPLDFELHPLDEGAGLGLVELLGRLAPEQLLVLIALSHYRGNGPYNDVIRRYRGYRRTFRERIGPVVVITENAERPPDRAHWFREEDAARSEGCELFILQDREGAVARTLQPRGSPHILALDRQGLVHYEGFDLDGFEWWEAQYHRTRGGPPAGPNPGHIV